MFDFGCTVVGNNDGTYTCSYTAPDGVAVGAEEKSQLEVLLNGKQIVGSPFAVDVQLSCTSWTIGSCVAGQYDLSEGGAVVTSLTDEERSTGVVADGAGCVLMISDIRYWELEVVVVDAYGSEWSFEVCRPDADYGLRDTRLK